MALVEVLSSPYREAQSGRSGMTARYREFRFWSPFLGCPAARLSMADSHGREYFAIVPRETAVKYRDIKERALDAIEAAIEAELKPGEVKVPWGSFSTAQISAS